MTYRPRFHVTPPSGRLNDPNGITLVGDTLHVFYQHDPGFPHAVKRTGWGHAVTTLGSGVWRHLPDALYPDVDYDKNGCYSGSSVVVDDRIRLFYTGNVKNEGQRRTTQNLVEVEALDGPEGGFYRRHPANPLIDGPAPGYTAHFRDPHVTRRPDGTWLMVLGAQRDNGTGAVVMYSSADLEAWEFSGEMEIVGLNETVAAAYMWECPNLLRFTDEVTGTYQDVLVFCPQFPGEDLCGYVVGDFDGARFSVETDFTPLDHGHEFYAPQLVPYRSGALMLGWMGLPGKDDTPSLAAEGWVHQLTFPREVSLRGGVLHQQLVLPQGEFLSDKRLLGDEPVVLSLVDDAGAAQLSVEWSPDPAGRTGIVVVARGEDRREARCAAGEFVLTADGAAIEITAGGGEVAFSSSVFTTGGGKWAGVVLAGE